MVIKYGARLAILLAVSVILSTAHAQDSASAGADTQAQRPPLEEMPQPFQIAFWLNQAALAFDDLDYEDWAEATEKLHALRPYNQDFMTHLVRAYAHLDRYTEAYNMMLLMQQQGLAQDWSEFAELEPMRQHELYDHLNMLMTRAGEQFGEARRVTQLERVELPEALAHDAQTGRFFLGTVRDGDILVSSDGQTFENFANREQIPDLMAVLDIEADAERRHLWVATAAMTHWRGFRQADAGRTALLKLDLDSGELLSTHRLIPDRLPHAFGALAIADDGTIYASDTATPAIYRLAPGDQFPRPFFAHQNFSSLRGIALSDDDSKLYVADYEIGIFVVETSDSSKAWKLFTPENLNEGGIDGLYFWNGYLVAIQNGISPERVLRMKLGDDGLGVVEVAPLLAALPQFDAPTYGVVVDEELIFLAGSHWHHVDTSGRRLSNQRLPDIALLATGLESAKVLDVGQEMVDELIRRRDEQQRQQSDDGDG
jgi:hypothetical protein